VIAQGPKNCGGARLSVYMFKKRVTGAKVILALGAVKARALISAL